MRLPESRDFDYFEVVKNLNSMLNRLDELRRFKGTDQWNDAVNSEWCQLREEIEKKISRADELKKTVPNHSIPITHLSNFKDIFLTLILPYLRSDPQSVLNLRATCRFFRKIIPEGERIHALKSLLISDLNLLGSFLPCLKEDEKVIKCCLVGEVGVGKSWILERMKNPQWVPCMLKATIGVDFGLKRLYFDSDKLTLQMLDIAGSQRFGNMTRTYYKDAAIFFIVMDVTRAYTFERVETWLNDIWEKHDGDPNITLILLANKCSVPEDLWAYNKTDIQNLCERTVIDAWFEVDAYHNIGIQKALEKSSALYIRKLLTSKGILKPQVLNEIPHPQDEQRRFCPIQ